MDCSSIFSIDKERTTEPYMLTGSRYRETVDFELKSKTSRWLCCGNNDSYLHLEGTCPSKKTCRGAYLWHYLTCGDKERSVTFEHTSTGVWL